MQKSMFLKMSDDLKFVSSVEKLVITVIACYYVSVEMNDVQSTEFNGTLKLNIY